MTYEDIMSRVPEITWAMPETTPSHVDLALSDPYLDQALRTAARWVWSGTTDPLQGDDFQPSGQWVQGEADGLRALLFRVVRGEPIPPGRWWEFRVYVLKNLGLTRSYASSSRAAEQEPLGGGQA